MSVAESKSAFSFPLILPLTTTDAAAIVVLTRAAASSSSAAPDYATCRLFARVSCVLLSLLITAISAIGWR